MADGGFSGNELYRHWCAAVRVICCIGIAAFASYTQFLFCFVFLDGRRRCCSNSTPSKVIRLRRGGRGCGTLV